MNKQPTDFDLPALRARCRHAKPGYVSHSQFTPEMSYGRHRGPVSKSAHEAAVIVALCETPVGYCIPLTVRSDKVGDHRGQVSLPGGRLDFNESAWHAGIREFSEELGGDSQSLELLTPLTPIYVYASNHRVQPFLTVYQKPAAFSPNEEEVSHLMLWPVQDLLKPDACVLGVMQRGTCQYDAPGFKIDEHFVWGATALILGEVAALIRDSSIAP